MAAYDYINQSIQGSLLVVPKDDDPFFKPTEFAHSGFASDGYYYDQGIRTGTQASWYTEPQGPYRGILQAFPTAALCILSQVALTILDASSAVSTAGAIPLWMQFLLQDQQALANNFNSAEASLTGFTPSGLTYSGGVLGVTYVPDAGSLIQSNLAVNIDFGQDSVYLYVATT